MAETTTLKRSNPFGSNYRVVAGNNPKVQNNVASGATAVNQSNFKKSLPFKIHNDYNLNDNDINKLRTMVNQRNINDRANYAYDVALNLARRDQENDRRTRGFANFNTEADLTSKADEYYDQLMQGAEHPTGAQMRGENAFTQALGGIREGINGFNNMIGTGIDWGVDRFGDLVGAVTGRDDWKQSIQDATTGEDLAIIPDILEDIGLVALTGPVGGAALLGAKGLLQNTDNFQEALTGIDHITGARLTGGQRLANTAAGLGGTALTMLPGFSAAKAGSKLIGDELGKEAAKAVKGLKKDEALVDKLGKEVLDAKDIKPLQAKRDSLLAQMQEQQTIAKSFAGDQRKAAQEAIANIKKELTPLNEEIKQAARTGRKIDSKRTRLADASERIDQALSPEGAIQREAQWKLYNAPRYSEEGIKGISKIPLALRNPFSREARYYNQMAKQNYKNNLVKAFNQDRYGRKDSEGELLKDTEGKVIQDAGGLRKAIWNLVNGKTLGYAARSPEAIKAEEEVAKRLGKEIPEEATKEAAEQATKKGSRFSLKNINKSTKGQFGKDAEKFSGPRAIRGFGLTAGSGLAEVMANEPGGFQAAINNYADTMGKTPDNQLLPLALAMLPGYRKGFARMFGGNTLPYYGVKAQLAQRGVNNVYNNRYTDEDNENLLKAIGGK